MRREFAIREVTVTDGEGELRGGRLVPVGAVPQRAPMGHGTRGLQPGRWGVELSAARPRAVSRVPVGEDGLAGFSDREQGCAWPALWNGRDPILKERPFGLTGPEHG